MRRRAFVNIELQIAIVLVGLGLACVIPSAVKLKDRNRTHECARALDALGGALAVDPAAPVGTCPWTSATYERRSDGRLCCPSTERHQAELCVASGDATARPLASAHPKPTTRQMAGSWAGVLVGALFLAGALYLLVS